MAQLTRIGKARSAMSTHRSTSSNAEPVSSPGRAEQVWAVRPSTMASVGEQTPGVYWLAAVGRAAALLGEWSVGEAGEATVSEVPLEEVEGRLKKLLVDRFAQSLDPAQIDSDTLLWKGGLRLDSAALLEFIVAIEEEFAVPLSDSTLTVEHFQSLGTLAGYVQGLVATRGHSPGEGAHGQP